MQDAVADDARTRIVPASAVATIGQIIEPPDAAPVSAVKSTGIFILDRNLGGGLPSGSVVGLSGDPKSVSEIFCASLRRHAKT